MAKIILYALILALCSSAVLGFTIDDNDMFILSPGDTSKGSFVIVDADANMSITSDFRWVSFSESKYEPVIDKSQFLKIRDDSYQINYFISIPEEAEIGVYRAYFAIEGSSEVKYFNLKISVQNPTIGFLQRGFNTISPYWFVGILVVIFGFVFVWFRKN